uniref:Uncharacterized protein n=1 Tax=Quercus lobata TaxID=97700 RepID=A0A7N2RAV2_QUELO
MKQPVPRVVDTSTTLHKISLQGKWEKNWEEEHVPFIQQWANRENVVRRSSLLDGDDTYLVEYMMWYNRNTRWTGKSLTKLLVECNSQQLKGHFKSCKYAARRCAGLLDSSMIYVVRTMIRPIQRCDEGSDMHTDLTFTLELVEELGRLKLVNALAEAVDIATQAPVCGGQRGGSRGGGHRVLSDDGGRTLRCTSGDGAGPSHSVGHQGTVPAQTTSHGASTDYGGLPRMSPPVFSGSAHDGGCIFVPTLGMPTPPLVHVDPTMLASSQTPHGEAVRLDQSGHIGGNEKIIKCLSVTRISMQNVLIGENLGGCASISGSLLGENTGSQCVCCQEIDILEKTHKHSARSWLLPRTVNSGFIGMTLCYGLSLNMSLVLSIQYQCTLPNYVISVERCTSFFSQNIEDYAILGASSKIAAILPFQVVRAPLQV